MAYLLFADYSRRKGIPSEFRVSRSMLAFMGRRHGAWGIIYPSSYRGKPT